MYQIRSESAKTLIEDRNIRLPRFQRKQTWDIKKNFKLCISIFKNYPIGICVINEEKGRQRNTKWLLDGRQRRNALQLMLDNPEEIYNWSKAFLKIKNGDQQDEIEEKFWLAIEEHLEKDEGEEEDKKNQKNKEDEIKAIEEDIDFEDEFEEDEYNFINAAEKEVAAGLEVSTYINHDKDDLKFLLKIILICHNKKRNSTGFSAPFNFSKFISNLDYVDHDSGFIKLNGKKLVSFIKNFKKNAYDEGIEEITKKYFLQYLFSRFLVQDKNIKGLEKHVDQNWERIEERLEIVELIENRLRDTVIGIIDLKNATSIDAQNIFKLINSEGTDLTAVEILSAKPSWNGKIAHPSEELTKHVDELYSVMNIKREDAIVRWDFPATLLGRLDSLNFIFKKLSYAKETEFKTRLTLGFKILGAIYEKGITKGKISSVSKNRNIQWGEDIEQLVRDLNNLGKIISDHSFFKFLQSWNTCLMELTSDTIAINFLIIVYKDWLQKGTPIGSNVEVKKVQRNSIVIFDKMIYEYVTKQWRGPSDARLADNIEKFSVEKTFEPVKSERWKTLLEEIFTSNTLLDETISVRVLRPILYYYYCLSEIDGPNNTVSAIEIDHIIPQSLFESSTLQNKIVQHNLYNLALIPKRENISKGNKKLNSIEDPWLIKMIEKYTNITQGEFTNFSTVKSIEELKGKRIPLFMQAFESYRNKLLND
ncbi:DUF262 domain-containing protein [Priestia filamentosa]|uniref:GmrSD restriction endonuclease domain-containing protein n=1 Tax=Priestia filamentosa TaxID=1402861 RepID=UPI003982D376